LSKSVLDRESLKKEEGDNEGNGEVYRFSKKMSDKDVKGKKE